VRLQAKRSTQPFQACQYLTGLFGSNPANDRPALRYLCPDVRGSKLRLPDTTRTGQRFHDSDVACGRELLAKVRARLECPRLARDLAHYDLR
jgi:hypothetical protein